MRILPILLLLALASVPTALAAPALDCEGPVCDLVNKVCRRIGMGDCVRASVSLLVPCAEGEPCYWMNEVCKRVFGSECIPA